MKKISLLFFFCIFAWATKAQTAHPDYQDGKIWFRIKKDYRIFLPFSKNGSTNYLDLPLSTMPFISELSKSSGITKLSNSFHIAKKSPELQRTYLLEFTNYNMVDELIRQIEASGAVEYAEKVPLLKHCLTVNDPSYSSQWGLTTINATSAWNYFSSGSNVVVAVVDDAVERTHPDLSPNLWVNPGEIAGNGIDDDGNGYIDDINGYDVADHDNNPNPPSSAFDHGTHVAGIVGARSNNGIGVASIGFSVKLMCVKSTNSASSVTNGYDGVLYAAESGADVINMSWGGSGSSITAENIINYAYSQGIVLVAAAGNSNVNTVFYPAGYTNVIAVAATQVGDTKASFSNYGTWVDISAPGNNIYSTVVGGAYGNKSGTSMASPMVAGLAGLMLSLNPAMTNAQVRTCLQNSAVNINSMNPGYVGELGSGRIDANASMSCVAATLLLPPTADFIANTTTVTAGGSVNFTDLSISSPTSWNWTFTGGTPSSFSGATPPAITYNTPGTYAVSLTASNANGSDTETKTAYITVNPAGGCQGINYPIPSGWTLSNYYAGATVGADGWINGVSMYLDKQKAMYFNASSMPYTHLNTVLLAFGRAYSANPAKVVPVRIYNGTGGTVGALLGTSNLTMGQIMADEAGGYYTEASFVGTPIALPASKEFFVSVDLTNLQWTPSVKDTLSIVSNQDGQTVPSVIWEQWSDNSWHRYTTTSSWNLSASLVIHPFLTSEPTNAIATPSSVTICEDNSVNFSAAGSTFQDTLLWVFPGGTPYLSNNVNQSVMFNNPGTYTAKLYVVGGGCSLLDSAEVTVTVNPKPNISVTATASELCAGASSTLTASGASSYTWSPATYLSGTTGATVTSTPSSTIQYTVTGTTAGCQNSTLVEIEVLESPVANVTVDNNSICTGSSVNFDGSLSQYASSFNWTITGGSPAASTATGGTTSFATAGTYNVNLTVTNACGTDTDSESILVSNAPAVSFTFSDDTTCLTGGTVTMNPTPSGGTFSGTGVTGSTFDPAIAGVGTHTVTYTYVDGGTGCTAIQTNDIVVDNCLSVTGIAGNDNFMVFPNPAAYTLTIQGSTDFTQVEILDMTGRLVSNMVNINSRKATLSLNELPNGMYTVRILNGNQMIYQNKLVISK